jgi:type II secretory pathway predicted ATPase ExeA
VLRSTSCFLPPARSQCVGTPFTAEETTANITARMGAVPHRTDVFTREAVAVIYEQSKGIGWLINALCDQCLFARAIEHVSQIDDRLVRGVGHVI